MNSVPQTVRECLEQMPPGPRQEAEAVLEVVRRNLQPGFAEGVQYGMAAWFVPHSLYPPGYHCDPAQPLPFGGLACRKAHLSLHLWGLYTDDTELAAFQKAWKICGKKLDMGKACIRFRKAEDLALEVIAESLRRISLEKFIGFYERSRHSPDGSPRGTRKKAVRNSDRRDGA